MANVVSFTINGVLYTIDPATTDLSGDTRLVDFIRNVASLKGTKYMCREGGCGACVVTVTTKDVITGNDIVRSVNSCLIPAFSCNGWNIETVESLGNRKEGYHPIQQRLVQFSGTQCGMCSPGFVMNMYGLTKANENLTAQEIEDSFDGNICRCTGYRPILDSFKSFAVDASDDIKAKCADIEETCAGCPLKKGGCCSSSNSNRPQNSSACCMNNSAACCMNDKPSISKLDISLRKAGEEWVKATSLETAFEALNRFTTAGLKYRVVGGNTGSGVFKYDGPYSAYLDVNDVAPLHETRVEATTITFGAGNTLAFTINFLEQTAQQAGFEYTAGISKHMKRIANVPVRNAATLAGNLMMKHDHAHFPSDVFLLFETVGAQINIASSPTAIQAYTILDFLSLDMSGKLVVSLTLPQRLGHTFRSFKITKRHQNAHAYVNAGFLFLVDPANNFRVLEKPTIVFGGISSTFYHASFTENDLNGKELGSLQTLQDAMTSLDEVIPDINPPDASAEYRKSLTQNLLYKVILGILGDRVSAEILSGADDLPRLLTKGQQTFDDDTGDTPLYKPFPKLEAPAQVSGEAEYINDIPEIAGELFGAFVLSTVANATLSSIDATEALNLPGVVRFLQASDIPGENSNMGFAGLVEIEPIFVVDKISHAGQALGLIVAVNRETAIQAVSLVKVAYTDVLPPVISIEQAVKKAKEDGTYDKIFKPAIKSPTTSSKAPTQTVTGEFNIGGQAHVQMEPHITVCHPNERGIDVYSATQWCDVVQSVVAAALKVPNNTINISVRRLGGAYGCKISRASHVAAACALACQLTSKPVRVALSFEDNMALVGKRFPHKVKYEVGFDDNGKIELLNVEDICDTGAFENERTDDAALLMLQSCYQAIGWELIGGAVKTNTPPNTWTRAPGSVKGIAIIEYIMDHIAHTLQKDPIEVRRVNFIQEGDPIVVPVPTPTLEGPNLIPDLLPEIEASADYVNRKAAVEEFNRTNRWRKRGIALCPMRYPQLYGARYGAYIAIYHSDGTVAVGHAGIEMGQGLNTKIAQVVAHQLGIELEKIEVKPTNNLIGANSDTTGGAMTSELVSYAALMAAKELRDRIDEIKIAKNMQKATWEELIAACHDADVDLRATHYYTKKDPPAPYHIWGLNCVETEIDCLTGEFKIIRSDLLQDAGKPLNPYVDIGQVEGAYIMGMGLFTKERLVYDEVTGQLLTNNTWEYKVPFPKCIPEDFRVTLVSNRPNPIGVLSSKSTGEAPICLTVTIFLALKNAIAAARKDAGHEEFFQMDSPITPEGVVRLSLTEPSQFSY